VVRDIDLHQGPLDAITLSRSDLILFVAGQDGVVLSLMLPIMAEIKHREFNMHNKNITKVSYNYYIVILKSLLSNKRFTDEYDS